MKRMILRAGLMSAAAIMLASAAGAQEMSAFDTGPVFADFGPHAAIDGVEAFAPDTEFAHSFDVAKAAEKGERSRAIESAARFINMHVTNGVAEENIRVAVVVHGPAALDLLSAEGWAAHDREDDNGNAAMVREMLDHAVRFIVCGQSATAQGVRADQLIEGVEMDLSAMTAHARLQQGGYTVNPF